MGVHTHYPTYPTRPAIPPGRADPHPSKRRFASGKTGAHAFLLMHFIPTHGGGTSFWEKFGKGLAEIHKNTADHFGLDHHNFIGKLSQSNNFHNDWPTFYKEERILPQVSMAISDGKLSESVLGKLEKGTSLQEIWQSKEFREIRQSHLAETFNHPTCTDCTDWKVIRWGSDYSTALKEVFNKTAEGQKENENLKYLWDSKRDGGVEVVESESKDV